MAHGATLPVKPETGGKQADGHFTPTADKLPQRMVVPPRRVLPIVFLPGIMGSNLRMSGARQTALTKSNNVAWRPDDAIESGKFLGKNPAARQRQLDPAETEVDIYDPVNKLTGDKSETADKRNSNIKAFSYYPGFVTDTPLLMDDDIFHTKNPKTKDQKARERGWGEIYFSSYLKLLSLCEVYLNATFIPVDKDFFPVSFWNKNIINVNPQRWQAMPESKLLPLDADTLLTTTKNCWFPVHAMGYNWLQSNQDSGIKTADRIRALIAQYKSQGFQCEKVIVVTHSMGGLVARALIHPSMGKLEEEILGIVHGVMPTDGAGTAYKRMRCGFEDGTGQITPKVLGNKGTAVTAVLGNAQGGLELLPNRAYGNDWLQIRHKNVTTLSLPNKGDPYDEIYKRHEWYGLLNADRLNPANLPMRGIENTCGLLDGAREFHDAIAGTFHKQSYAHYGADRTRLTWKNVI